MRPLLRHVSTDLLASRVLVLDGAMGTMIQRYKLTRRRLPRPALRGPPRELRGDNDVLVLTRPDVIGAIHREYLAAGADIIETNTFNATAIAQADYGLEALVYEMNVEGGAPGPRGRRRVDRRRRRIARASSPARIGPTNRTLSISPDVNNPAFRDVTFDARPRRLRGPGRAASSTAAATCCCSRRSSTRSTPRRRSSPSRKVFEEKGVRLPLMISVTITDRSGRTLSGQTIDAFWTSIAPRPAVQRRHQLRPRRARHAPLRGGAGAARRLLRQLLPERRAAERLRRIRRDCRTRPAALLREFADSGLVNIVGGCCGTTPDHIRAIAEAVEGVLPRKLPERDERSADSGVRRAASDHYSAFSGLETLTIRPDSNFQMIGERTNVTGSARFARLIRAATSPTAVERRARAGARRRQHDRRQHGRGHARLRAGDDRRS